MNKFGPEYPQKYVSHLSFLENHYLDKFRQVSHLVPKYEIQSFHLVDTLIGKKNVFNLREVVEDFNTMTFIAPLRPIQKMLLLR